jgi:copper chaperone CopZ
MYCSTCKPIVEKQLKGEQAIKKIDIDFMTDSVVVEYNSELITKEEIRERLENCAIAASLSSSCSLTSYDEHSCL